MYFSASRIDHLSTVEGLIMLNAADIVYCESHGPYCKFYFTNNKTLVASKTLKEAEEILQDSDFFRIITAILST